MNAINTSYDKIDDIAEPFRPLFSEQDGRFVLTGVNGMKTQKDVDSLSEALRKERLDHGMSKTSLKTWGDLKYDDVISKLDRFPELELAAAGKLDDNAIKALIEPKVTQATAPLQRQITSLGEEINGWKTRATVAEERLISKDRNDGVRSAAIEFKAHPTAIADIELAASVYFEQTDSGAFVTKSGINGVTPGLSFKEWLRDMQKSRPHWWPASEGGGANGGGGLNMGESNPFSAAGWNLTAQGQVVLTKGQAVAEQLAKAAGTTVGGPKPKK